MLQAFAPLLMRAIFFGTFAGASSLVKQRRSNAERAPTSMKGATAMKKLTYLLAAAAMSGGLALAATPASAGPLATGLKVGNAAVPQLDEGLVQKVHGWHCRRRWSSYNGWHRHRRACDDYGYRYRYPTYGFGVAPFFSFGFFDDDDDHHHHHWRRHGHRRY